MSTFSAACAEHCPSENFAADYDGPMEGSILSTKPCLFFLDLATLFYCGMHNDWIWFSIQIIVICLIWLQLFQWDYQTKGWLLELWDIRVEPIRLWPTFTHAVIPPHDLACHQTDVMLHAVRHVHALIDGKLIVGYWSLNGRQQWQRNCSIGNILPCWS